jgi:glycolate oxidase
MKMSEERLNKEVYKALEDVVGPDYISDAPAILDSYAYAGKGSGELFNPRFAAIILPKETTEVQGIVRLCNKYGLQFKAASTGWGSRGSSGMIWMDLRRMNRIIEINEKNMFAVVEPYVVGGQLQAELMKRGLNYNVIGAGANCSALPYAAHYGGGHMSETTSLRERNILGAEWVTPDGEIIRMGSLGSIGEWFCADGPGPSLRGLTLGTTSPMGAMGVFTKAATKLYPWSGPIPYPLEGHSPCYYTSEMPPNCLYRYYSFPTAEDMSEAQRRISENEIAYEIMGFTAAMMASNIGTNNEEDYAYCEQFLKEMQGPGFQVIIIGNSPRDFEFKKKLLERIIEDTKGESLKAVEDPKIAGGMLWRSIRITATARECFRAGGAFGVVLGGSHPYNEEIRFVKQVVEIKKEWIKKGVLRDDHGGYLTWTHEHGHLGHAETLFQFAKGPEAGEAVKDMIQKGFQIAIDSHYGVTLMVADELHYLFGPHACNYHLWMKKIKQAFDPNEAAEPSGFISGKN